MSPRRMAAMRAAKARIPQQFFDSGVLVL
jgi:hypothetical protein